MSTVIADVMPSLKTIYGVELVTVGDWNASTGPVEFTLEHLQSMIVALDDPAVHDPRLRIGHTPPNITAEASSGGFEEQPAFGRFVNLRLEGSSIVADAVGVPAWLAAILPAAFPSRSVEVYWNVHTAAGRTHPAVITSVALLGVTMPAVETLDDLRLAFGAEMPDGVEFTYSGHVAASKGAEMPKTAASVATEDVRQSFYNDFAQGDYFWWWCQKLFVDPKILIADDDETGALYAVPYTIKGDKITWGDPAEVRVQFVYTDDGRVAASAPLAATDAALTFASPAASGRPSDRVRAATVNEGASMNDEQKKLAAKLGLGEDATVEQLNEKLQADALTAAEETPTEPAPDDPTPDPDPKPVASSIDPATLAQLQADAQAGREARAEQVKARQTGVVEQAIKAGKFPPARRDHYLALMSRDEEGTTAFIETLAAGAIPVSEMALSGSESAKNDADMARIRASFGLPAAAGKGN